MSELLSLKQHRSLSLRDNHPFQLLEHMIGWHITNSSLRRTGILRPGGDWRLKQVFQIVTLTIEDLQSIVARHFSFPVVPLLLA